MTNLKLKGSFRVKTFNQQNELVRDSNFFSNYITSSGLSYPFSRSFADCFLALSIGTGNTANSTSTTGLHKPVFSFLTGIEENGCGFIETETGVSLYRAWRVPEEEYFTRNYDFTEFSVSPSNEAPDNKAFSRVLNDISVVSGDYAVITYKLDIGINTGIKYFEYLINTANARVCNQAGGSASALWAKFSGIYRQLTPSIKYIRPEGTYQGQFIDDIKENVNVGDSYIPVFGNGMEPYISRDFIRAYLSTDNLQFLVSPFSGGKLIGTGNYFPYSSSGIDIPISGGYSGLMEYKYNLETLYQNGDISLEDINSIYSSPRKGEVNLPDTTNFLLDDIQTIEAQNQFDVLTYQDTYVPTDRSRSVRRLFSWLSTRNNPELPTKSLILTNTNENKVRAFVDCLIFPTGGKVLPEIEVSYPSTPSNEIITSNQEGFLFLDVCNTLYLTYKITWSAD